MELPKIYKFIKEKYEPILVFFFVLPESDLLYFFESLKNKVGFVQDYCGYEVFDEYLTFWEDSGGVEKSVKIRIKDFLFFIDPLVAKTVNNKTKIELILSELLSKA